VYKIHVSNFIHVSNWGVYTTSHVVKKTRG
jgi:hypothetical protein